MANIIVKIAADAAGKRSCLKVMDADEHQENGAENGMALRRVLRPGDNLTWTNVSGTLTITFPGIFPFPATTVGGVSVPVLTPGTDGNGNTTLTGAVPMNAAAGRYKYTISLNGVMEDPQIIIDNSQFLTVTGKRTVPKKARKK